METNKTGWQTVIIAICLIYILLRLWNLTETCLWFDEIFSVHAAALDWQNLFWFVAQDLIHPPLFYVLLKIWIHIGGESLFWLRMFPVLFSAAALLPFYFLCRLLKIAFPAIALAFLFLAVNGSLVKYAQEIRMYAVLLCLSLFSVWIFVRFFNLGKSFNALVIINILLVYTHYFGWFVILTEVIAVCFFQRIKIKQILIMLATTATGFLPWVWAIWQASQVNANFSQNLGWAAKPNLTTVFHFFFDAIEPFYFQQTSIDANSIFVISAPVLLAMMVVFVVYFRNWNGESKPEKNNFLLIGFFFLIPVLLAFSASWMLPVSIWGTRHLIIIFAPLAILQALAITKVSNLYIRLIILALIFWTFGIAGTMHLLRGSKPLIICAWSSFAIDLQSEPQDLNLPLKIYAFEDVVAYDLWFSLRREKKRFQIVKVNGINELEEDTAYFLPRGFDEIQKTDENGLEGGRFFIAFRAAEWNEKKAPLRNLIDKNYKINLRKTFKAQGSKAFLVEVENYNKR